MADFEIIEKPYPEYNNMLEYGKSVMHQVSMMVVGSGSHVMVTDTEGSRWGSKDFENANAWIKMDGSFKLKASDGSVLMDSHNVSGDFISIVNSALDTTSQTILKDFTFEVTDHAGAFKAGNVTWNAVTGVPTGGSGLLMNAKGLMGVEDGDVKFTIPITGSPTFGGELIAASGTFGSVTAGLFTGCTFQTRATGTRVVIADDENIYFRNSNTLKGRIFTDTSSDLNIYGVDDVDIWAGGSRRVHVGGNGMDPCSNDSYDLGQNDRKYRNIHVDQVHADDVHMGDWKWESDGNKLQLYHNSTRIAQFEDDGDLKLKKDLTENAF